MNTNTNTANTDANNKAAQALANMLAGTTITDHSTNGGTTTLTPTGGNTITIRHETKENNLTSAKFSYIREEHEYVSRGISSRAKKTIKNRQTTLSTRAEKRETYEPHTPHDEYNETPGTTTETIKLWATFEGDLRPTLLTQGETEHTWRSIPPNSRLTRGDTTATARTAHMNR